MDSSILALPVILHLSLELQLPSSFLSASQQNHQHCNNHHVCISAEHNKYVIIYGWTSQSACMDLLNKECDSVLQTIASWFEHVGQGRLLHKHQGLGAPQFRSAPFFSRHDSR